MSLADLTGRVYLDVQNVYNRTILFGFTCTEDQVFLDTCGPGSRSDFSP